MRRAPNQDATMDGSCPQTPDNRGLGTRAIAEKIARISSGSAPRVLDLFSGCGGLSLGFHRAGFKIVGGVDADPEAAATHAVNFHGAPVPGSRASCAGYARDIRDLEPEELISELNAGAVDRAVDVVVGGPPCQAYARVGRSKLREVLDHPDAYRVDPRGNLYLRYLEYVQALQPLVIVMENVPDVLNYGGHNVAEETAEILSDRGYECRYSLLNAAFYGVPQMRERMVLIAYHRALGGDVAFPAPICSLDLPYGYELTRQVALKHREVYRDNGGFRYYVDAPEPGSDLPPGVTARLALGDLPPITYHLAPAGPRRLVRPPDPVAYRPGKTSAYAADMRRWPGFESTGEITDHIIRHLPRDYRIFKKMKPGDQYPQAHAIACALFTRALRRAERSGKKLHKNSNAYKSLLKSYVPPYDTGKFPNKWRKMEPDHPARTVMAHLGKDSYSHIHYDSAQARTISVREAARLQSFPDGFRFCGAMNAAYRQIGNAVPPLMAHAVAVRVMEDVFMPLQARRSRAGTPNPEPAFC